MPISIYERFTAHDWIKYSGVMGKITTVGCWLLGLVNILFGFSWLMGLLTIDIGFLLAIWELPIAYSWFSKAEQIKEFCLENMKLKYPATKAILYLCLSSFCYWMRSSSITTIVTGLLLMISGILYIFAQINQNEDAHDGTSKLPFTQRNNNIATDQTNLLNGGNTFGTFI